MIEADELTISGIPFWEISIEQLSELFPSDEEFKDYSLTITEDGKQYTQVRNRANILRASQENGSQGLDSIQLWEYSELRGTDFTDDPQTILEKLGISAEGVEYSCSLIAQGHVIRFVKQSDFWREDTEHAGTTSPGYAIAFIWSNYNSSQDLILSFNFSEECLLVRIMHTFLELGY